MAVTSLLIYAAAYEMESVIYKVVAALFALISFSSLIILLKMIFEGLEANKKLKTKSQSNPVSLQILLIAIFFFFAYLFIYKSKDGEVDTDKIKVVDHLILSEKVQKRNTGGKGSYYYYEFKFKNCPHLVRLPQMFYDYSNERIGEIDFSIGDTLSLQILESDMQDFEQKINPTTINIINVTIRGKFIIDHIKRNTRVRKSNKMKFSYAAIALMLVILGIIFWEIYHRFLKLNR